MLTLGHKSKDLHQVFQPFLGASFWRGRTKYLHHGYHVKTLLPALFSVFFSCILSLYLLSKKKKKSPHNETFQHHLREICYFSRRRTFTCDGSSEYFSRAAAETCTSMILLCTPSTVSCLQQLKEGKSPSISPLQYRFVYIECLTQFRLN